jgi:hypothetical protein
MIHHVAPREPGRRRSLLVANFAFLALLSASAGFAAQRDKQGRFRETCGVERWTVKTLQDRPTLLPARTVTLRFLVTRRAPQALPPTRLPFERHVFRVRAAVTLIRPEGDGDLHVVLRDGADQMIAEAPSTSCTARAKPLRRHQMARARAAARVCRRAILTGVAFFDFDHGQTGVAPNAIELHPLLAFTCTAS